MVNFSFIIPHKNIPSLLSRCLDSIPIREDIEIIIVDDNSSPDKVDFSTFPGSDRPNVKLIFDKNGKGAGAARNIGIQHAVGKWIFFTDADDTYTENLSSFLNSYVSSNAEVIYFKCRVISESSYKQVIPNMNIFIHNYLRGKGNIEDIKFGAWEPWNKMIKRETILKNGLKFDEISSSNDKMFSLKLGKCVEKVEVSGEVIYNYILRSNSIIHRSNRSRFSDAFYTVLRQNSLYHEVGYARKTFVPFFFLQNYKFVTKRDLKEYYRYLKDNKTHPFEGFIHNFLFLLCRKHN